MENVEKLKRRNFLKIVFIDADHFLKEYGWFHCRSYQELFSQWDVPASKKLFSLVGYKGDRPAFQSLSHISLWDGKNHFDHPPRKQGTPEKLH